MSRFPASRSPSKSPIAARGSYLCRAKSCWRSLLTLLAADVVVVVHGEQQGKVVPTRSSLLAPDSLATILYTSGTTGRPRGVMLSQRNLAANAAAIVEAYGGDADEVRLNVLPLSHIYARTCDLYTWVYPRLAARAGREPRDDRPRFPAGAADGAQCRAVRLSANRGERVELDAIRPTRRPLRDFFGGRMKRLNCGGAAVAAECRSLVRRPRSAASCRLRPDRSIARNRGLERGTPAAPVPSAGRLPNVEVRLADDGEVLVRGPNVMLGYWQDRSRDRRSDSRRLASHRRPRRTRRRRLPHHPRPQEGADRALDRQEGFADANRNVLTASPLIEQAAVFGEGRKCARRAHRANGEGRGARSEERGDSRTKSVAVWPALRTKSRCDDSRFSTGRFPSSAVN